MGTIVWNLVLCFVGFIYLGGCATPPAKYDPQSAREIKHIAVVGFTSLNEVPDPMEGLKLKTMAGVPTLNTFAKMTEHAQGQYQNFLAALNKEMGWKVVPQETVFKASSYQGLYANRMKDWKNITTPDPKFQIHFLEKVFPYHETELFTHDVRQHMMEQLKVDALAFVEMKSEIIRPKLSLGSLGIGGQRTQTSVKMKIYRKGSKEEPIWQDLHAEGPKSKEVLRLGWTSWDISMEPRLFEFYRKSSLEGTQALFQRRTENKPKGE